tara:strand:+ start:1077 stop:1295 length:219 start_codon:yes stop_codon:yes gene_type:complete
MKKQETVPFVILQDQLRINRLHQSKIYWYETFIEYIEKNNSKLYKKAKKYTDNLEANDYFTEEDKIKWGIKD